MLRRVLLRYEEFLRIDSDGPTSDLVRARSVYAFGWTFVLIQLFNLVSMTHSFGAWSRYHVITVCAMVTVLAAVHSIRYVQNFNLFTGLLFVVLLGGVTATAIPSGSGVNTSLLPYIVITPMICGFISGWRMALIGCACCVLLIWSLFGVSMNALEDNLLSLPAQNLERAWQATYAVILATVMGCAFAATIFHAFGKLERTAERARRAEAAKARFLANMSHELRTPLNGVLGLTQSMRSTPLNEEQRHVVNTIEKSGDALLAILNDILDLSKIDAGRVEITEHEYCIRKLTNDVLDTWRETAREKGLLLSANIDGGLPPYLLGDDIRIRQIMTNLVSNALKFTENGGVTVRIGQEGGADDHWLLIKVTDSGPGIAPEALTKIFEPFEQGDPNTTRKYGGTGLGLSICRNLTNLMGGDLSVSSELGYGAAFEIRLPLRAVLTSGSDQPSADTSELPSLEGINVLIVEDNTVNQMVVQRLLKGLGADYDSVENGKEAIERLTENVSSFDVVLMDKHMPVMDGVEATGRLRAMEGAFATLPIIACTADAMSGEAEQLLAVGFTGFITKPIRREILAREIFSATLGKNFGQRAVKDAAPSFVQQTSQSQKLSA